MSQLPTSRPDPSLSPLESYLREINETPLLTAAEEKELARRIAQGDAEARDHLVRANLRLVVSIARRYVAKGMSLQDLIAEGNLGLLRAVEAFDPAMNTRFSTYASYWIRQSIRRVILNTSKVIRIPAYMVDLLSSWRQVTAKLEEKLGRAPTPEEVARKLKLPKKKLGLIKRLSRFDYSGTQFSQNEGERPIEELVVDSRSKAPETCVADADDLVRVMDLLKRMDRREATVLRLHYGLDGKDPLTLQQIGDRLGLTRERVRQIEHEALERLSASLVAE